MVWAPNGQFGQLFNDFLANGCEARSEEDACPPPPSLSTALLAPKEAIGHHKCNTRRLNRVFYQVSSFGSNQVDDGIEASTRRLISARSPQKTTPGHKFKCV